MNNILVSVGGRRAVVSEGQFQHWRGSIPTGNFALGGQYYGRRDALEKQLRIRTLRDEETQLLQPFFSRQLPVPVEGRSHELIRCPLCGEEAEHRFFEAGVCRLCMESWEN